MSVIQDFRYALRVIAKSPGYSLVAILVLALGIGANTAIFSVVDALVFRPISFDRLERIVSVMETEPNQVGPYNELSPANYADWRIRNNCFEKFAVARYDSFNLASGGSPEHVTGARVSSDFFDILGIRPEVGRLPVPEETSDAADGRIVVLSHNLWVTRFASDRSVAGKTIRVDGQNFTVAGVAPPNLMVPVEATMWAPLIMSPELKKERTSFVLHGFALLKPGVSVDQAQAQMQVIAKQLESEYPDTNTGRGANILPLPRFVVGPTRQFLLMQLGAVGFVLLIACANVANLQLAHAIARRKETAIRYALGAGRHRVLIQSLIETLWLSIGGAVLGILIAYWGLDLIRSGMPAEVVRFVPGWEHLELNWRAMVFTITVGMAAALVTGLIPAIRSSRPDLQSTLRETPSAAPGAHRLRGVLVTAEVALAVVLLTGAVMMTKGFWSMLSSGEMHAPDSVLNFELSSPPGDSWAFRAAASRLRIAQMHEQIRERLLALPGVQAASGTTLMPYSGAATDEPVIIEGDPPKRQSELPAARVQSAMPGYFEALRIPVLSGRALGAQDGPDAPRAAVVSTAFVKKFLHDRNPIGTHIIVEDRGRAPWTIVGVVPDVIHHWYLDQDPIPTLYRSHLQYPTRNMHYAVRVAGDPLAIGPAVEKLVHEFDPELPVQNVKTMRRAIHDHYTGLRYSAYMMTVFSALALLLACMGVYAVISCLVAERTHEIGIRMALGASYTQVTGSVLRQSLRLIAVGLGLGILGAVALAEGLSSLLFGVSALEVPPYAGAVIIFLLVGVAAAWFPARRAMRVDPLIALRQL
jgi:putative ABC transport system permease protein